MSEREVSQAIHGDVTSRWTMTNTSSFGRLSMSAMRKATMTDKQREALQRRIQEHTRSIARDPEAARISLIRMGIIDEDGRLTPEYQPETDPATIAV